MFLDFLSSGPLGASALALMVTALVVGVIGVRVSGARPVLVVLMAALGTLIYHLVYLTVLALTGQPVFLDVYMNRFILPGVVFNLALGPVVYLLLMMVDRRTSRERLEW
jgi:cell shape-determining protein MreD